MCAALLIEETLIWFVDAEHRWLRSPFSVLYWRRAVEGFVSKVEIGLGSGAAVEAPKGYSTTCQIVFVTPTAPWYAWLRLD